MRAGRSGPAAADGAGRLAVLQCGSAKVRPMTVDERERLIRRYANGEIAWHTLRERGFASYLEVLDALGALGLRPPVAPMEGPNVEARRRGRAVIREALQANR